MRRDELKPEICARLRYCALVQLQAVADAPSGPNSDQLYMYKLYPKLISIESVFTLATLLLTSATTAAIQRCLWDIEIANVTPEA